MVISFQNELNSDQQKSFQNAKSLFKSQTDLKLLLAMPPKSQFLFLTLVQREITEFEGKQEDSKKFWKTSQSFIKTKN